MAFSHSGSSHHQYHHGAAMVPHRGSLYRIEGQGETMYALEILLDHQSSVTHELAFLRKDFDFALRLFSIMDTESRGQISKATVQEFVTLRCPVFWRRDEDLEPSVSVHETSPTFEEVWMGVAECSLSARLTPSDDDDLFGHPTGTNSGNCFLSANAPLIELGLEGWMVFCRFIALAQYLEAKRRFSGRHLQQTMRHRNAPRGSELVVVDVPPVAPPVRLTAKELALYEQENRKCLPLPELDLDHSLLAAHDVLRRRRRRKCAGAEENGCGIVKVELFGSSPHLLSTSSGSHATLEFCLTYVRSRGEDDGIATEAVSVRRSMSDMKWLNDTFVSHKVLGGTLCGRILPPFPGNRVFVAMHKDDSTLGASSGAIAAAANVGVEFANAGVGIATASVGMLKQGIKSLWGGYAATSQAGDQEYTSSAKKALVSSGKNMTNTMQTYYNPNSPAGKARHLERYINYLLEHPALSTSFPLNTILKASQSGLEAAKHSVEEHTRTAREINDQIPQIDDGKLSTFWSVHGSSSIQPNLAWVRTAAQAAVALQLHGVLETTGLPSASARLQHASLPTFNNSRNSTWADDDGEKMIRNDSEDAEESRLEESFEEGVMHVQDELESDPYLDQDDDNGYDLLPLPVPAPERQILNVSEAKRPEWNQKETRFRYGSPNLQEGISIDSPEDEKRVFLGEMAIDENIDKLREVIGSVDNILSRCAASSGGIERSRRHKLSLHLDILRGLDSWEGLRGKFVSQRALLKGLSGIEQSKEVFEESDLALVDDISWQTALAHSAVSAAEDVRSTVRAARTASNAKAAATSAAQVAQAACNKGKFSSIDEARGAQTRASIAQSHAIHAAVVEHEAKTVKRRGTLALAHDVKCWNAHRKREVLQICLTYAKSQHEATRRAVDAWSCLRDGYVGSTIVPSTQTRRAPHSNRMPKIDQLSDEVEARIYANSNEVEEGPRHIVAVEHHLLKIPSDSPTSTASSADTIAAPLEPETFLPLVMASPISDDENEIANSLTREAFATSTHSRSSHSSTTIGMGSSHAHSVANSQVERKAPVQSDNDENEVMTSSMQSLVDGLMNWGGVDIEEDFALPTGMAASIALEESGVFGKAKII